MFFSLNPQSTTTAAQDLSWRELIDIVQWVKGIIYFSFGDGVQIHQRRAVAHAFGMGNDSCMSMTKLHLGNQPNAMPQQPDRLCMYLHSLGCETHKERLDILHLQMQAPHCSPSVVRPPPAACTSCRRSCCSAAQRPCRCRSDPSWSLPHRYATL